MPYRLWRSLGGKGTDEDRTECAFPHKRGKHQWALFFAAQVAGQQQMQLLCHRLVALVAPAGEGGFQVGFAAGHRGQYIIHQVVAGAHRRLQQLVQGFIGTVGLGAAAQFVVLGGQVLGLAGAQAQGMNEPLQLGAVGHPLAVHYFI